MASTLAMFPGQGSQFVGMREELRSSFPQSEVVFEEAEDGCSLNLRKIIDEGPEDELKLTKNTQPCLLATSIAYYRILKAEAGFAPTGFAGHSLGEYSALVAAGGISLGEAAGLVRLRGEAMQDAVPVGHGGMAAIIKCPAQELEALCSELSTDRDFVQIANFNSPEQMVVAGHAAACERLAAAAAEKGYRAVPLPVSAPFHSALMSPAKDVMRPKLGGLTIEIEGTLFPNLLGKAVREYKADYLIDQIDHPVLWSQTLAEAHKEGFSRFIEVGPGKVLFGLARRTLPRKEVKLMASDGIVAAVEALSGVEAP